VNVDIEEIFALPDGASKTVALVCWLQSRVARREDVPVLVGGAAVEILTAGAYTTGDLDFVGPTPPELVSALADAGFSRRGRHWIHEEGQVFIEFPGTTLDAAERADWIEVEGHRLRVVSVEDLLVDRLGAWEYWRSAVDGANAWFVWHAARDRIDADRLRRRIREAGWDTAFAALLEFAERWDEGEPPPEELEAWANAGPERRQ
jgi:hypothetical protein